MSAERYYRRLLWAYPGAYRRRHGAEIVTTLLEMAEDRPGRPTAGQKLHLVACGLRQRFRLSARHPLAWEVALLAAVGGSSPVDRAVDGRDRGPILRNAHGVWMDRHAATRRLKQLADTAGIPIPRMHPHMLRHTYVTIMLDAGVSLRDVQIAARHADPRTTMRYDRARKNLDRRNN